MFVVVEGIDGMYRLPNFLSRGGRELIPRMLYSDPVGRITIPEIRQHPWFQTNLPAYLQKPWEDADSNMYAFIEVHDALVIVSWILIS